MIQKCHGGMKMPPTNQRADPPSQMLRPQTGEQECLSFKPSHGSVPRWRLFRASVSSGYLAVSLQTWFPCPGTEMCDVLDLYTFTDLKSDHYTDLYKRPVCPLEKSSLSHSSSWLITYPAVLGIYTFLNQEEGKTVAQVIRDFVCSQSPWNSNPSLA